MGLSIAIAVFLLMQVLAAVLFKWGSTAPHLWWWGFGLGNMVGVSSIIFMMYAYARMHPNLALAICVGGSFFLTQIALALIFRSPMNIAQWGGVLLMILGILAIAYGGKTTDPAPEEPVGQQQL